MGAELVGQVIDGRYRIVSQLGAGGVGAVYRAEPLDPASVGGARLVALKLLHDEFGADAESRERFQREARALNGLHHPNIVEVLDFGMMPDGPYLVMELLSGMPLDAYVEKHLPPPEVALDLARQVIAGLAFAHSQGVIHRDMKTENVFVTQAQDGALRAKILDFGLAKFVDDERWGPAQKLTMTGAVFGTPAYMSPEQGTGQRVDARSDVYSTAVVVFETLTGTWPFLAEDRMEMLKMHLMEPVPKLSGAREGLGVRPELQAWLERALAKLPEQRFANAVEMLAALDAIPRPAAWLGAPPAAAAARPGPAHAAFAPSAHATAAHAAAPAVAGIPHDAPPTALSPMAPSPIAPRARGRGVLLIALGVVGLVAAIGLAAIVALLVLRP
jgi:serine/threonine-protein kinase